MKKKNSVSYSIITLTLYNSRYHACAHNSIILFLDLFMKCGTGVAWLTADKDSGIL